MKEHLGLGVLIGRLAEDGSTNDALKKAIGKTIESISVGWSGNEYSSAEALCIKFSDGMLSIWDGGQSCCENRYLTVNDDLTTYGGEKLVSVLEKEGPNEDGGWEIHEIVFLEIQTNKSTLNFSFHNVHNGYYGGFCLRAKYEEEAGHE